MDGGALSGVLAITATHRAHAWDVCVGLGALAAFAPVMRSKKEAALVAGGLAGAAIGATVLPMLLRLPAVIATRSAAPLFVGDRMAIGALLGFAAVVAILARRSGKEGAPTSYGAPRAFFVRRAPSVSMGPQAAPNPGALRALDAVAPSLGVIVALGRVGCFLEGCDFGTPSSVAWAVRYPVGSHAFGHQLARGLVGASDEGSLPVHPAQLYEAIVGVAMIGIALAMRRSGRAREGAIFRATIATYAVGRFVVELFRGDDRGALGPFSVPQWMAIALLAWCAAGLLGDGRSSSDAAG